MKLAGCCSKLYVGTPQSSLRLASSAQGTPFGCPKGEPRNTNLQTPYKIKLPACTRKYLNINITDTGKGNNRRWQATGGQWVQRANSAGRFRYGCTRKLLSSGKFARRCGRSPYLFQGRLQCTYNHPKNEQIASRNQGWFRFIHKIMWFLRGRHHFVSRNFPFFFSASARNAPSCRFCKFLSKVRGRLANPNAIW